MAMPKKSDDTSAIMEILKDHEERLAALERAAGKARPKKSLGDAS